MTPRLTSERVAIIAEELADRWLRGETGAVCASLRDYGRPAITAHLCAVLIVRRRPEQILRLSDALALMVEHASAPQKKRPRRVDSC